MSKPFDLLLGRRTYEIFAAHWPHDDELWLKIFPITLGSGKRLFAEGTIPVGFKLLQGEISPRGVVVATYRRAGEVKTGSFALEPPTEAELARRKGLKEGN